MKVFDEVITSRNNPLVKWAASLADKKGRDAEKSFIVEGKKLVFEALNKKLPVTHIFVAESKKDLYFPEIMKQIKEKIHDGTKIFVLSDGAFEKISTEKAPQGIISVIKYLDFFQELDIIYKEDFFRDPSERMIVLSSVRDPANLGSVIRSAVAFGAKHIVASSDSADIYNPKTLRAAMGSPYKVKITYIKNLFDFIIGNEGHGIAPELSALASGSVYIPISVETESLNAAVAAGIFMWEQSK